MITNFFKPIKKKESGEESPDTKKRKACSQPNEQPPLSTSFKRTKVQDVEKEDKPLQISQLLDINPEELQTMEQYQFKFDCIAEKLLNHIALFIGGKPYRLLEVEFYFNGGSVHTDWLTHSDSDQQSCSKWYFHKTGGKWRSGNYKGLDVTFGKENTCFGGILIRCIENLSSGLFINGTSLIVDHILSQTKHTSIRDFVEGFDMSAVEESKLYLAPHNLPHRKLYKGPRVGLTLKRYKKGQENFIMRPYRFLTSPAKIKKGKINTVLGLVGMGKDVQQIESLTRTKAKFIRGYIDNIEKGKNLDSIKTLYSKALKNEDLCILFGWALKNGKL